MPSSPLPQPWNSFFADINESLTEELTLHCLGGFVMTMVYGLDRSTADVDVLPIGMKAGQSVTSLAGQGSILHKRYGVYLQVVGVAAVPINYEDRLTEMFPRSFNYLRLFALDPYDLALSKLERNTQRDRDDVKHLARTVPLDLNVMQERYEKELRPDLGNPQREDLTLKLWMDAINEERQTL
jgi:hypothetical protein